MIGGRLVGEIKPDGRLNNLGLAGGLHMELDAEIRSLFEWPGQTLRRLIGGAAREPVQYVSSRWACRLGERDSAKTGSGVALVTQARLRGAIQAHHRVMHGFVAGSELHRPHVTRRRKWRRDHE